MADIEDRVERALAEVSEPPDLSGLGVDALWAGAQAARAVEVQSAVQSGMWLAALWQLHGVSLRTLARRVGLGHESVRRRIGWFTDGDIERRGRRRTTGEQG
ncbi:hypothetical protein [Actinomycetospora aeridis]|uniref:Homeodomain-like domain-containing protein n=1 Tax=Actinomycetospora aeridis TaxID=3129231 RepID=A0ABU8N1N7_9PSEU